MSKPPSRIENLAALGEVAACDLCGSDAAVEVYATTIRYGPPAEDYFSSSRRMAAHGRIVKCMSCGLVRTSPRDDPQTLRSVYARLCDPLYDAETQNREATARRGLSLIERYSRPPGRLLDVGCSTGVFLAAARERGWTVEGIEASEWAVLQARERYGLATIHRGFVEDAEMEQASFDVITMYDLLEHVDSPTVVLRRVHDWIRQGGFLFLNVPNFGSVVSRVLRSRWPLLLREHLWYFSPTTIERFLDKTGFDLIFVRSNRVTFSFRNVFARLEQYGGAIAPVWRRLALSTFTRKGRIRFPIGELNVVARRKE
jgi:2-polyprenyl-3-methyl-5-hydroxy-6-metoxy-1,4-benzoquinol methylase